MIAYKGFNSDLTCTMGRGTYRYEIGKAYREDSAKCVSSGFHCVEEPIEVLTWYSGRGARYCIVEAAGDINEDGQERIACTEMTILKEIDIFEMGRLECEWLIRHPDRKYSTHVKHDTGKAEKGNIVIVRGKSPKAAGKTGSVIFLLKEEKNSQAIVEAGAYRIGGKEYLPDVYYRVDGRRARCTRKH